MNAAKCSADLQRYIEKYELRARLLEKAATESTADGCAALNATGMHVNLGQFIKAVILVPADSRNAHGPGMVMLRGKDRMDPRKVEKAFSVRMVIPSPQEAAGICAYPRGGTPPVGAEGVSTVVIDRGLVVPPRMLYGGGGDQRHVIEIHSDELLRHLRSTSARVIVAQVAAV